MYNNTDADVVSCLNQLRKYKEKPVQSWVENIEFEKLSTGAKVAKKILINPLANYLPAKWFKKWLADGQSELALANWRDPGGWRSMVISYLNEPSTTWDRLLIKGGTIPMALRNRKKLATRLIAKLIDGLDHEPAEVLGLGAGPAMIIADAMSEAKKDSHATLVDLSSDAFDFGKANAEKLGIAEKMNFIQGDVRDVAPTIKNRIDIVKMIGILEYLQDDQIAAIANALSQVMPKDSAIVFNSISKKHGTDRFFRRVFGLNMIHRSAEQLQEIFRAVGFGDYEVFSEPLGVYDVVVGKMVNPKRELTTSNDKD